MDLHGYNRALCHIIVNDSHLLKFKGKPYYLSDSVGRVMKYFEENNKNLVLENQHYVFGSLSRGSEDSTSYGPVSLQEIIGKVIPN